MKNEIKSLTGVRGIAACSVMFYHLSHIRPFAQYNFRIVSKGYLCVDLFFVLSGFVMALVYSKTFQHGCTKRDYRKFLFNRMARVFPLHLAVALFFGVRMLHSLSLSDFLANVFMVQGWGIGAQSIAGNSWSVSTEVFCYLLFPILIVVAFSRWYWVQVMAAVFALFYVASSPLGTRGPLDIAMADSFLPLFRCIAGFSIGLVAYRFSQIPFSLQWLSGNAAVLCSMALVMGLMIVPRADVGVVLAFPLLIVSLYYNSRAAAILFGNPVVHHLGIISYSIYLWHPFFRDIAGHAELIAAQHGFAGFTWLFAIAAIASAWIASWASYVFIEVKGRTALNWLKRQTGKPTGFLGHFVL